MREFVGGVMILLLSAVWLAMAGPARAEVVGDARVAFSADRTLVIDDRTYMGKVYSMPGRQRHEQDISGVPQVILLQVETAQGYLVVPSLKSYVEFRYPRAIAELSQPTVKGTALGVETVNGVRTTRYRIEHAAADGTMVDGYGWVSAEGIIMKLDGTYTRAGGGRPTPVLFELTNLHIGPQNPVLFEVPPQGMIKLPAGALQPLLGGKAG